MWKELVGSLDLNRNNVLQPLVQNVPFWLQSPRDLPSSDDQHTAGVESEGRGRLGLQSHHPTGTSQNGVSENGNSIGLLVRNITSFLYAIMSYEIFN